MEVKMSILKGEIQSLLDEFARSYDLRLEFTFSPSGLPDAWGRDKVFNMTLDAFKNVEKESAVDPEAPPTVTEKRSENSKYEWNWKMYAGSRGLDKSLLGKVVEINSNRQKRMARYKIVGLNSASRRKKYCVAVVDIDNGKSFGCAPASINAAKVLG